MLSLTNPIVSGMFIIWCAFSFNNSYSLSVPQEPQMIWTAKQNKLQMCRLTMFFKVNVALDKAIF